MIPKQAILDRSREWQLRPEVVEKDYVLDWVLSVLARHPAAGPTWVFKGGSCLKKCYFETYRFSDDLDFTLLPNAPYTEHELRAILVDIADGVSSESGIEMPTDKISIRRRHDKLGRPTFSAKISYRGPLRQPNWPTLGFDITAHEPVVSPTSRRLIAHAYDDELPAESEVQCYSFPELFAEKSRALFERTRPRDLYDVVYMAENCEDRLPAGEARSIFIEKCRAKNRIPPTSIELALLVRANEDLRASWSAMLGNQLPGVPPIDVVLERLEPALAWMHVSPSSPLIRPRLHGNRAEVLVAPSGGRFWGGGVPLDVVRFAGMNRLLVAFNYNGRSRITEPYSLRQPATGNLLLYAWEVKDAQIKAFKVGKMSAVRVTDKPFAPRYAVEFTAWG